jgi:WhiB family redox-sensing transcriptional regulator
MTGSELNETLRSSGEPFDLAGFPQPPEWMASAVCAQVDPALFFIKKGGTARHAKAICAVCPVVAECLEYAMEFDEHGGYGIFGGLTAKERQRLRNQGDAA